jgi:protein kinase C substrate 80K-H
VAPAAADRFTAVTMLSSSSSTSLLLPLLLLLGSTTTPIAADDDQQRHRGLAPDALPEPGATTFRCADGSREIKISHLNDDFCDCRDGSDERGTSACSQIPGAPGFYCPNAGHTPKTVPPSRVNDGICDCCDGGDEYDGPAGHPPRCANTCDSEAAVARVAQVEAEKVLRAGLAAKAEFLSAGRNFISKAKQDLQTKSATKATTQAQITKLTQDKARLEAEEAAEAATAAAQHDLALVGDTVT